VPVARALFLRFRMSEVEEAKPREDEQEGFDLAAAADLARYVLRAPKRRPWRFAALLAASTGLACAAFALYPRTYSTEVKILAQQNLVLPALGNPNRTVPREADNPTKNVGDTILRHDNLVGLIKQVDLLDRWESTRPPLLRAKDRVFQKLLPEQSEHDRMRSIEGVLEKRLTVKTEDSTITITAAWTDARMAYDLASAVERNFVDARYDAEISVIDDAIDILQQHAKEEKERFDQARVDFESIDGSRIKAPVRSKVVVRSRPHPAPVHTAPAGSPVDPSLLQALEDKRAAIQTMEAAHKQQLADLNRQLSEALVTYRPEHPTVLAIKQKIAAAKADPPELVRLRGEERALIDQVAASAPAVAPAIAVASSRHASARTIAALTGSPSSPLIVEDDPAVTVARMKLQQSAQKYADLETRIDGAKIELDIAKTAHKYRYSLVRPAEVSKRPQTPNPVAFGGGLFVLVLAMSFGGVVVAERRRGILVEPWQIERKLKLPILGDIEV
jgi:hypothetical protein